MPTGLGLPGLATSATLAAHVAVAKPCRRVAERSSRPRLPLAAWRPALDPVPLVRRAGLAGQLLLRPARARGARSRAENSGCLALEVAAALIGSRDSMRAPLVGLDPMPGSMVPPGSAPSWRDPTARPMSRLRGGAQLAERERRGVVTQRPFEKPVRSRRMTRR